MGLGRPTGPKTMRPAKCRTPTCSRDAKVNTVSSPLRRRQGRTPYLSSRTANWLIGRARVSCCSPPANSPRESVTSLPEGARPEDLPRPAWPVCAPCCSPALTALFEQRNRGFLRGGGGVGGGVGGRGRNRSVGSPSPLFSCPARGPPVASLTVHISPQPVVDGSCVPPPWPLGVTPAASHIYA
jgi:hypothetical protein